MDGDGDDDDVNSVIVLLPVEETYASVFLESNSAYLNIFLLSFHILDAFSTFNYRQSLH